MLKMHKNMLKHLNCDRMVVLLYSTVVQQHAIIPIS